jgi:hypothetical protein
MTVAEPPDDPVAQATAAMEAAKAALDSKAVELLVGWRAQEGNYGIGSVDVDGDVRDGLIQAANATLGRIQGTSQRRFDIDVTMEERESFVAPAELFPDDDKLLAAMQADPVPSRLKPDDLGGTSDGRTDEVTTRKKIVVYGLRCRVSSRDTWAVFVNKADPWISARSAGVLAFFGQEGLRAADVPVFQFRPIFDLLIAAGAVVATGYTTFDQLFRPVAIGRANAAVDELVKRLPKQLPLSAKSADSLKLAARRSPRVRNRLRVVLSKKYLDDLTPAAIRTELKRQRVPATLFLDSDGLVVDQRRPMLVLSLLDEDLYRGGFSGELWVTERKSRSD